MTAYTATGQESTASIAAPTTPTLARLVAATLAYDHVPDWPVYYAACWAVEDSIERAAWGA